MLHADNTPVALEGIRHLVVCQLWWQVEYPYGRDAQPAGMPSLDRHGLTSAVYKVIVVAAAGREGVLVRRGARRAAHQQAPALHRLGPGRQPAVPPLRPAGQPAAPPVRVRARQEDHLEVDGEEGGRPGGRRRHHDLARGPDRPGLADRGREAGGCNDVGPGHHGALHGDEQRPGRGHLRVLREAVARGGSAVGAGAA